MRDAERGASRIKSLLVLAILAGAIFVTVKVVPVLVENYELADYIRNMAVDATVAYPPATVDGVTIHVLRKADSLGLPVRKQDIYVSLGQTNRISVNYHVPVDLEVYTLDLHFTPSAKNSRLN